MAKARKARAPYDPAAATRAALERKDREAEIARLIAGGATVTTDRAGQIISARRSNVFTLLLARGTITPNQYDAAYRLAQDWATWKGLDGRGDGGTEFVDGGSGCAELVTDRMIQAGRRVANVSRDLAPHHMKLLTAFMVATVEEDRPMDWRGIVDRICGETARDDRSGKVVGALEALRQIYEQPRAKTA